MGQVTNLVCDSCGKAVVYAREEAGDFKCLQLSDVFPPEVPPQQMAPGGVYSQSTVANTAEAKYPCSRKCAVKAAGEAWDELEGKSKTPS